MRRYERTKTPSSDKGGRERRGKPVTYGGIDHLDASIKAYHNASERDHMDRTAKITELKRLRDHLTAEGRITSALFPT